MKRILPIIVISQFFCTSLWFAGNAVIAYIIKQFHVDASYVAHLTSAVQFGFIIGTLIFAILSIADRFSPSRVFFVSAVIAALINLGIILKGINTTELILLRFFTGFFLAGIYPIGMKIASDHYQQGLGRSLGFLVGALVLGTAFPHLLKTFTNTLPFNYVIYATSLLGALGGLAMLLLVPDGPYRKASQQLNLIAFLNGFKNKALRTAAFGYFGHMWELYAFWVFVPIMLSNYNAHYPAADLNVPLLSFLIIAAGSIACVIGGLASQRFGVKPTATFALLLSCICCIISPLLLFNGSQMVLICFLVIWSMAAIADSPLFSTLIAKNAPEAFKGSSLTIVNCIGFSITILSIQLIHLLMDATNSRYIFMLLSIGPVLGLIALVRNRAIAE